MQDKHDWPTFDNLSQGVGELEFTCTSIYHM